MQHVIYNFRTPEYKLKAPVLVFDGEDEPSRQHVSEAFRARVGRELTDDEDYDVYSVRSQEDWEAEIRREWKLDKIIAMLERGEIQERGWDGEGRCRFVYLGSLINPSGKYYLPFACSNVIGDCPVCTGRGTIDNPDSDPGRYSAIEAERTRLFAANREKYGMYFDWPSEIQAEYKKLQDTARELQPLINCPVCGGDATSGSASAAKDVAWREAFDNVLQSFGKNITLENGEGDPCDYFLVLPVDDDEEEEEEEEELESEESAATEDDGD